MPVTTGLAESDEGNVFTVDAMITRSDPWRTDATTAVPLMPQLSGISPARSAATACVLSATLLTWASRPYFLRKPPSSADQIAAFAALTLTEPRRTFSEAGALVGGVGALAPGAAGLGAATPPQATSSPPTEYTRSSRRFRVGRMFGTPARARLYPAAPR